MSRTFLQKRRVEAGFSQSELARLADMSLDSLRLYEHQTRKIECANIKTLLKISNVLKVPFWDLFDDESLRQLAAYNISSFIEV